MAPSNPREWYCNLCGTTYIDEKGDGQCPACLSLDVEPVGVTELPLAPGAAEDAVLVSYIVRELGGFIWSS